MAQQCGEGEGAGCALKPIFDPRCIAVVGASEQEGSVGAALMGNLVGTFPGTLYPVNPNHDRVGDRECFSDLEEVPETPDLAVIATPASAVTGVLEACGKKGVPGAVIISAGFGETGEEGRRAERELDARRREYGMRIVGPNCLGIIRPGKDLNLSFLRKSPRPGGIAFFSQSGAMGSAILDWADQVELGFSAFVSVGNMMDVNFGDLIDHFGRDPETTSIIMYLESVTHAAHFMKAARAFARAKPLLVIKAGKHARSAEAVASHTGSLAGQDAVYDAAFRRVGVTRVEDIGDLFTCSEMLDKQPLPSGPRVCIVTNAGGPGILTADAVLDRDGELAELSAETRAALQEQLPPQAGLSNPVDVMGDADAERYRQALRLCAQDAHTDGLLVIYSPQGQARAEDAARAVAQVARETGKPVVAAWLGGEEVAGARRWLRAHDVPCVTTPEAAVRAYLALHQYGRNRELLHEIPEEIPSDAHPPKEGLRSLARQAIGDERRLLTEQESKRFLSHYGIPTTETHLAPTADEAVQVAERLGYPVVLKVVSPEVTHKSEVGGVLMHLDSAQEVREGFARLKKRLQARDPQPHFAGVTVQPMVEEVRWELILGAKRDPVFGMVLVFGRGGTDVEWYRDTAVGFPPMNQALARDLVEQTKISRLLHGYRNAPPADLPQLYKIIVRFAQMIMDFPEIQEFDINPLAVRDGQFIALDARISLDPERGE